MQPSGMAGSRCLPMGVRTPFRRKGGVNHVRGMNGVRTPYERRPHMHDEWLTYGEAAKRLNISVEAVRQRAIRGRWQRTQGNDGRARVRLPDGERTPAERSPRPSVRTPPSDVTAAERLVAALEAHVETLKADLASERERSNDALAQLAAEKARADLAIENYFRLAHEYERRVIELVEERARPWWRRAIGG